MTFKLDHIVHFVKSPEEALEKFKTRGLHAVEGGKHENLGTYNALSYFGLSYIELIGLFDKQLTDSGAGIKYSLRDTFRNDHYVDGLSRIALRTTDIEAEAERFRNLGLEVNGPDAMNRIRPDGSLVSWKLLYVGDPSENLELPFFIQWDEGDEERQEDLTNRGIISDHSTGNVKIASVGFTVHNLEETVEKWSNYLGLDSGEIFVDESLNANAQKLRLPGVDLIFYSPNGEGIVAKTLDNRGEKPFLVNFEGANQEAEFQIFDATYRFSKYI